MSPDQTFEIYGAGFSEAVLFGVKALE